MRPLTITHVGFHEQANSETVDQDICLNQLKRVHSKAQNAE